MNSWEYGGVPIAATLGAYQLLGGFCQGSTSEYKECLLFCHPFTYSDGSLNLLYTNINL